MKQAMKKSKDASGIMTLNKQLADDVERQLSRWVDSAKKQGADLDKMSEQELKYIIELNKPKGPTLFGHPVIDATSAEGKGITEALFGKKGEVFDLTGKKIKNPQNIMGGIEGIGQRMDKIKSMSKKLAEMEKEKAAIYGKGDIVTETITTIKSKKPIDAMAEANSVIGRKGKYKNLTEEQSKKILKDTEDHIFERDIKYDEFGEIIKPDPEDFAHGGRTGSGLNYLLGEDDQNSRVPFGAGGFNAARRAFLKLTGAGAAGIGAAKSGLFGLLKGGGKKEVIKELTQVPINNIDGMPAWFKPLVNQVIKKGDDVTKKFGTVDREIVHKSTLPDSKTDVLVTQDLTTGNVSVDIGLEKHGFAEGKFGQPVRLEYKASEVIEPIKGKKGTKTKEEFSVEEAEFTGGHPENVKFEGSTVNKFGDHESNFSEVEAFATGKTKKTRNISSLQKQNEDLADHFSNYPEPDDFASGGRVPLGVGGIAGMLGE